jgi:hypothetical protein
MSTHADDTNSNNRSDRSNSSNDDDNGSTDEADEEAATEDLFGGLDSFEAKCCPTFWLDNGECLNNNLMLCVTFQRNIWEKNLTLGFSSRKNNPHSSNTPSHLKKVSPTSPSRAWAPSCGGCSTQPTRGSTTTKKRKRLDASATRGKTLQGL